MEIYRVMKIVTAAIIAGEPLAVFSKSTNKLVTWILPREMRVQKDRIYVVEKCGGEWIASNYDFVDIKEYCETFVE